MSPSLYQRCDVVRSMRTHPWRNRVSSESSKVAIDLVLSEKLLAQFQPPKLHRVHHSIGSLSSLCWGNLHATLASLSCGSAHLPLANMHSSLLGEHWWLGGLLFGRFGRISAHVLSGITEEIPPYLFAFPRTPSILPVVQPSLSVLPSLLFTISVSSQRFHHERITARGSLSLDSGSSIAAAPTTQQNPVG